MNEKQEIKRKIDNEYMATHAPEEKAYRRFKRKPYEGVINLIRNQEMMKESTEE